MRARLRSLRSARAPHLAQRQSDAEDDLRAHAKAEGYELLLVDRLPNGEQRRRMFEATHVALDDPQRGLPTGLRVTLDRGCLFELEAATETEPGAWGERNIRCSALPHWALHVDRRRKLSIWCERLGCFAVAGKVSAGNFNRTIQLLRLLSFDSLAAAGAPNWNAPSRDAWRCMVQSATMADLRRGAGPSPRGVWGPSPIIHHWLARRIRWVCEFQKRSWEMQRDYWTLETVLAFHASEIREWGDRTDREFPPLSEIDQAIEAAARSFEPGAHP